MKKLLSVFACLLIATHFLLAQSPVALHGALKVSGSSILDQNNSPVSFAGMSLFWSNTSWGGEKFYNTSAINSVVTDWKATIVRAAMGVDESGGYISDAANNKTRVKTVVDAAIANGIYVIIDFHSHYAHNYKQTAIDFFKEMATTYGSNPNVIYEIYNEPLSVSWSSVIKPYALDVIKEIRAIDPDNLIIVGTPNWSQDVDVASTDPITSYSNIAYTLHFYAGTHGQSYRDKAITAMNNGIALMVTEWGTVNADGNGSVNSSETDNWVTFMCQYNLSNCNWSLNDKSEGASALNSGVSTTGPWSSGNLTSSGTKIKSILSTWCGGVYGGVGTTQTAYNNTSQLIPGKVEMEKYDVGGQSVSYYETTNTNEAGSTYRGSDPVDIGATGSGGYSLGYVAVGEWLEYTVNVSSTDSYTVTFNSAAASGYGGTFNLYVDGVKILGPVSTGTTASWSTYQVKTAGTVNLTSGTHLLKLEIATAAFNLDYVEFTLNSPTNIDGNGLLIQPKLFPNPSSQNIYVEAPANSLLTIYDVDGKELINQKLLAELNCLETQNFSSGVYFVTIRSNDICNTIKFIKN